MNCSNCGIENEDNALFCQECGEKLDKEKASRDKKSSGKLTSSDEISRRLKEKRDGDVIIEDEKDRNILNLLEKRNLGRISKVCRVCKSKYPYTKNACTEHGHCLKMDFGDLKQFRIKSFLSTQLESMSFHASSWIPTVYAMLGKEKLVLFSRYEMVTGRYSRMSHYFTNEIDYRDILDIQLEEDWSDSNITLFLPGFRFRLNRRISRKSPNARQFVKTIQNIIEGIEDNENDLHYRNKIKKGIPKHWFYDNNEKVQLHGHFIGEAIFKKPDAVLTVEKMGINFSSSDEKLNKFIQYKYINEFWYNRHLLHKDSIVFAYLGGGIKIEGFSKKEAIKVHEAMIKHSNKLNIM